MDPVQVCHIACGGFGQALARAWIGREPVERVV